ncbi:carboxypeptidase-like regulatory domain-containing protein [Aureitalea marina]|uniref:Uncharacterized protein n=1 Tax=Aureitalea marina TaxID=930804 RepID=A0A2S7KSN4_9FLAO|nr:carboxypeptidase-like regulatory domain-containing protein [Aureitalea marina]PQB05553.1 hypothetical protein BST85_12085 [Aureitalea marina]
MRISGPYLGLVVIMLFSVLGVNAQYIVTLDAEVRNQQSSEPVVFANVRILDKQIGTITGRDGSFLLRFDDEQVHDMEVLEISALGYQTRQITLKQVYRLLERQKSLELQPLDEAASSTEFLDNQGNYQWGRVLMFKEPLQGAKISIPGTYQEVYSNSDGLFKIPIVDENTLNIEFLGAKTASAQVNTTDTLNVALKPEGERLDEVVLSGQGKDPYGRTPEQKKRFNSAGFAVSQLTAAQIPDWMTTMDQVMSRVPNLWWERGPDGIIRYFMPRSAGMEVGGGGLPIIVIDDMIYPQNLGAVIPEIPVSEIDLVSVMPRVMAVIRYGPQGGSGAIVIETKQNRIVLDGNNAIEERSGLIQGNDFEEELTSIGDISTELSFVKELEAATSFEQAKEIHLRQVESADKWGIGFYTRSAAYFSKWDKNYSLELLMKIASVAPTNVKALRTLAYHLDQYDAKNRARSVYQRIMMLSPGDAQSYRDLANIYVETGEVVKGFELYKLILANETEGVDFSGLTESAEMELRRIVKHHKGRVDYMTVSNDLLDHSFKKDVRIVFQWNDPSAEFEVQFVNPQNKYYNWNHDMFAMQDRMTEEASTGAMMEEFVIDDANSGNWQINVRSMQDDKGVSERNPITLKYTLYRNYGKPDETQYSGAIDLSLLKQKVALDQFLN